MNWQFGELGWRLLPGSGTALVVALLLKLNIWSPLEQLSYQALFRLRGAIAWDTRVVVVAIDDASLKALGRFPWSRQRYAQLLNALTKADASVVAFDILWSEPSAEDAQLALAMQEHGRVVAAQAWDDTGIPLVPTPLLQESAIAVGHILKHENSGNFTRQIEPQVRDQTAFGVAVVQAYGLVQAPVDLPDLKLPLWINWPGPVQQAASYSFVQVLRGHVPPQAFKDKIVLVGLTATGFDPLATPFNSNPSTSGIYLHAAVVSNLLQQNPLHLSPTYWLLIILLGGGPGFSFFLSHWRLRLRLASWLGLSLVWVSMCVLALWAGYWLPVASPLALFAATVVTVLLCEQLRISALLQRQVKHLWQAYTPEVVLDNRLSQRLATAYLQQPVLVHQASQLAVLAEQLGRSQSAQAAIARSLSSGLLAADLDGLVWFCNPVAAALLQIKVGDRLDNHLIPEWLSAAQWQADLQSLKAQKPASVHEQHHSERWLELKLEPLFYQPLAGTSRSKTQPLDGVLLILNDITERYLIEQMKSELVALVSHELRTPLTSIQGALKLLQTGKLGVLPDKGQRLLDIAANNTNRLMRLTNDLLDLERIESGLVSLSQQDCQIADLLEQAVTVMQLID
ncbi:MAG: CHASE2 domain-containing protein [Stenomitos frigidus ULC029]